MSMAVDCGGGGLLVQVCTRRSLLIQITNAILARTRTKNLSTHSSVERLELVSVVVSIGAAQVESPTHWLMITWIETEEQPGERLFRSAHGDSSL
jgi:hypothetical protein